MPVPPTVLVRIAGDVVSKTTRVSGVEPISAAMDAYKHLHIAIKFVCMDYHVLFLVLLEVVKSVRSGY